jgi:thymidine kinase
MNQGRIEVICGGMFAGKSEELMKRLRRAIIAKQKVEIFKPRLDDRYAKDAIVSHDQNRLPAINVSSSLAILTLVAPDTQVIGIDEGQFLDAELTAVCTELANTGRRVIVAALDTDYRGQPFESIPPLLAVAEEVHKEHAVCNLCGQPACRTHRLTAGTETVELGAHDAYQPLCRRCFVQNYTPHQ